MAIDTGFHPEVVAAAMNNETKAYEAFITAIGDTMQTQFIGGMSDKWACVQAQNFFRETFKPAVDKFIENANDVFRTVFESINDAGAAWAASTLSDFQRVPFNIIPKKMNVDGILENIAGVRGIDKSSAEATSKAALAAVKSDVENAVNAAVNAVRESGFIGGSQEENLVASLQDIKNGIENIIDKIETCSNHSISETVAAYSDTAGRVAAAFAGN